MLLVAGVLWGGVSFAQTQTETVRPASVRVTPEVNLEAEFKASQARPGISISPTPSTQLQAGPEIVIDLDNTGVASWRYRNPRNPPLLFERPPANRPDLVAFTEQVRITFDNLNAGAPVKVSFGMVVIPGWTGFRPGISTAAQDQELKQAIASAETTFGVTLSECETRNGTALYCQPSLSLGAGEKRSIIARLLLGYPEFRAIKFSVSLPFALEAEQPANKDGYVSLDATLRQAPTTATLTASGAVSFAKEPFFGSEGAPLDNEHRFTGAFTKQAKLTARTALAYAMGDRASAFIELQFKNSALGRKDEDLAVKANQYNFQVSSRGGVTFKFGKYLFAAPTEGLAINEVGEGATLRYKWLALSHIVKRESAAGVADGGNDDHYVWLGEITSLKIKRWKAFRAANVYFLRGTDKTTARSRTYSTAGGEMQWLSPKSVLMTAAYYRSRSSPGDNAVGVTRAEGHAWLGRASRTWHKDKKSTWTLVGTVAGASGDNRATSTRYEGYVGENAAWSPDGSLFLTAASPRLTLHPIAFTVVDGDKTKPEFSTKGLANFRVVAASLTSHTIPVLSTIADMIENLWKKPEEKAAAAKREVVSQQTTWRVQHYRSATPYPKGHGEVWELQFETLLESPKGVKTIVKLSQVLAGRALETAVRRPWSALAQMIVTLK